MWSLTVTTWSWDEIIKHELKVSSAFPLSENLHQNRKNNDIDVNRWRIWYIIGYCTYWDWMKKVEERLTLKTLRVFAEFNKCIASAQNDPNGLWENTIATWVMFTVLKVLCLCTTHTTPEAGVCLGNKNTFIKFRDRKWLSFNTELLTFNI